MPIRSLEGLPLHTRSLTVSLWRDENGHIHARGDIIDLRKNGFVPSSYDIQPSGIIHSMSIDLEVDPETLRIESLAVDQPFIAISPSAASEGECCRDPAPRLLDFVGDCLDSGFTRRLSTHFGGPLGCSHLLTLFQLMASAVPYGIEVEKEREQREKTSAGDGQPFFRRSLFVDGHLRDDNRLDVAVQLADTHSRPIGRGDSFTERLESSHEWKLLGTIDRKRFELDELSLDERKRNYDTLGTATWTSHGAQLEALVGTRVIPGLAGRVFKLYPNLEVHSQARDALLQLAPGFIQIVAALMDDYYRDRAEARKTNGDANSKAASKPEVANLGGNSNSCYMWRENGPISQSWSPENH